VRRWDGQLFLSSFDPIGNSPPLQIPILKMKTLDTEVFKSRTLIGAVFCTNWKFLAKSYVSYFCKNYARIEKCVGDKYQTILEIAYASVITNN
jgi:hypothetical protein